MSRYINMDSVEIIIEEIKELFEKYGSADYIGENVTQIEHAVQTGIFAFNDKQLNNYDNYLQSSVIVASFLHDIGHLIGMKTKENKMTDENGILGIQNHELLASQWLQDKGFNKLIQHLVKNHVNAKRFLCTTNDLYRSKLSDASFRTLQLQGGLMDSNEIKLFKQQPFPELCVKIRIYDDNAKVIKGLGGLNSDEFNMNLNKLYNITKKSLIMSKLFH